jgi:uncharacterized membrane protein (DUF4010 family)
MLTSPDTGALLSQVGLAFGIGLLIGLERGWTTRDMQPGTRVAGVRTFAISGLLGGMVAALTGAAGPSLGVGPAMMLGFAFATFSTVIVIYSRGADNARNNHSATTVIAAMLTFILGSYSVLGSPAVAAAAAVATAGVLVVREGIHRWIAQINRRELESALALLAMSFIALPVVPDRAMGPFGGVNMREVWIIAIVLAAISFAGYIAVKYFGERRGVMISAAFGGIVSSTAVAVSHARRAAAGESSAPLLAAATALAMAVSFARVIAITTVLQPMLAVSVAVPLLAAAAVAVAFALLQARRHKPVETSQGAVFRNPFGFWMVIGMAAIMGILIVAGRLISERFGDSGAMAAAATMGLFDVDAMTVSMARLAPNSLTLHTAALAILVGVTSNTFVKVLIAASLGRGRFALHVAAICLACTIAGGLVLAIPTLVFR